MGHVRIGKLPRSREWKEVVGLIADGSSVEKVAGATIAASAPAFATVQNDVGFGDAVALLAQLAVAPGTADPDAHLASVGLNLPSSPTAADVAAAIHQALDSQSAQRRAHSDFAELAQNALVSAVSKYLGDSSGPLNKTTASAVRQALARLGRPKEFGQLSRAFFARLSCDSTGYFLSKTLGSQVGEGQRFETTGQVVEFEHAMARHADAASAATENFSQAWISRQLPEGRGNISPEAAGLFGWEALNQIRVAMGGGK